MAGCFETVIDYEFVNAVKSISNSLSIIAERPKEKDYRKIEEIGLKENIENLCVKNGITIYFLETQLGYGNGSLRKTENINVSRAVEIANYFGVSLDELIRKR